MLETTGIGEEEKKIVEWHEEEYLPAGKTRSLAVPEVSLDAILRECHRIIKKQKEKKESSL